MKNIEYHMTVKPSMKERGSSNTDTWNKIAWVD